jgi:ribosomal protein S19E (S16A)
MADDVTGFEIITLERLSAGDRRLPYDVRVLQSLAQRGFVQCVDEIWDVTPRGQRALLAVVDDI